jgi:hypothetical protein
MAQTDLTEFQKYLTTNYRSKTDKGAISHRSAQDACSMCRRAERIVGKPLSKIAKSESSIVDAASIIRKNFPLDKKRQNRPVKSYYNIISSIKKYKNFIESLK